MKDKSKRRLVSIEIIAVKGKGSCPLGLKKGEKWEIDSAAVPDGFCGWAYHSLFPFLQVLRFGGSFPWEKEGEATVCCPDPDNTVVFKLKAG